MDKTVPGVEGSRKLYQMWLWRKKEQQQQQQSEWRRKQNNNSGEEEGEECEKSRKIHERILNSASRLFLRSSSPSTPGDFSARAMRGTTTARASPSRDVWRGGLARVCWWFEFLFFFVESSRLRSLHRARLSSFTHTDAARALEQSLRAQEVGLKCH